MPDSQMPEVPETDVTTLPAEIPDGVAVLDVREDDEWDAGHIEGATHIPMSDVPGRMAELPEAEQIIVVCRRGGRSARVTEFLVEHGVPAINLDGGMQSWAADGRPMTATGDEPPQVI